MAETSLPWGGIVTGDCGPYSDDAWSDMFAKFFLSNRATQGVFINTPASDLQVSVLGDVVSVSPGAAMVDGKMYTNSAQINFAITDPGSGTAYYRVVLRKSWANQTVRAVLLGPSGSAPALTQVDGTTWEIPLALVTYPAGGPATVSSQRQWVAYNTKVPEINVRGTGKIFVAPQYSIIGSSPQTMAAMDLTYQGMAWITDNTYPTKHVASIRLPEDMVDFGDTAPLSISAIWIINSIGASSVFFEAGAAIYDCSFSIDWSGSIYDDLIVTAPLPALLHSISLSLAHPEPPISVSNSFLHLYAARLADNVNDNYTGATPPHFLGWEITYDKYIVHPGFIYP